MLNTVIKVVIAVLVLLSLGILSVIGFESPADDPWHTHDTVHTPYDKTLADIMSDLTIANKATDGCQAHHGVRGYDANRNRVGCSLVQPPGFEG